MNDYFLKSVRLQNFQYHTDATFNFTEGLNVITGLTGTGKSAIFKALEWIYGFSSISEIDYRKEGTDVTYVTIVLQSGFEIEKTRSNTINRYVLRKEGCEDKVFDSVGKDVPEEVKVVLGMTEFDIDNIKLNVNFAEQDDLNFIFDKKVPASFCAKLFNKLTGNELIDVLFKECNRENLRTNREVKVIEKNIATQEEDLAEYSIKYKTIKNKLSKVQKIYEDIQDKIVIYENLKDLADKLKVNKDGQEFVDFQKSKIKTISEDKIKELKAKAEKLKKFQELDMELKAVKMNLTKVKMDKEDFARVPKVNFEELKEKEQLLQKLTQLKKQLVQTNSKFEDVMLKQESLMEDLSKHQEELKEVWEQCSVCPLCGGEKK